LAQRPSAEHYVILDVILLGVVEPVTGCRCQVRPSLTFALGVFPSGAPSGSVQGLPENTRLGEMVSTQAGSAKANGRLPKSCLGPVFNFKLSCFALKQNKCITYMQTLLELKAWPRFCPLK